MGSNKYIITKMECWPALKQDPKAAYLFFLQLRSPDAQHGGEDAPRQAQHLRGGAVVHRAPHIAGTRTILKNNNILF